MRKDQGYGLVHGFEHAGDQEVVLEFHDDGLVCECFEDREYQLQVMFRLQKRLWKARPGLTIVAGAGEEQVLSITLWTLDLNDRQLTFKTSAERGLFVILSLAR